MSPTLKPCPFCGSAANLTRINFPHDPRYDIECHECWVWGRWNTEADAITAWNTRALEREAKAVPVAWKVRIPRGPDAYEIRFASTAGQLREMEAKWPLALVEPLYASPPQNRPASQVRDIPEGWQPIETAPRDGTKVLLWGLAHNEAVIGWYLIDGDFGKRDPKWVFALSASMPEATSVEPTLWQPLPSPPAPESE